MRIPALIRDQLLRKRFVERKRRDASRNSIIAEQVQVMRANQPLARFAFLALLTVLVYMASVAYISDDLSLLLNTKVNVLWNVMEFPRRWVLGLGAVLVVFLQYEALSLHHRAFHQYIIWKESISPQDEADRTLWLHGGLVSEMFSATSLGALTAWLARFILFASLWVAPLLVLLFIQAVTLKVHSEILTWTLRFCILVSSVLVINSACYSGGKVHIKLRSELDGAVFRKSKISIRNLSGCIVAGLALCISFLVCIWPGERWEGKMVKVTPASWVFFPQVPAIRYHFLNFSCDTNYPIYPEPFAQQSQPAVVEPPTERELRIIQAFGGARSPLRGGDCTSMKTTLILTQLVRQKMGSFSRKFNPTYNLSTQVVNGSNLSPDELKALNTHTEKAPLHPDFEKTLRKVSYLDLSDEDLAFGNFAFATLVKTQLPDISIQEGTSFYGAQLQGAVFSNIVLKQDVSHAHPLVWTGLQNADISGSTVRRAYLENTSISGLVAIDSTLEQFFLVGGEIYASDFRFSKFQRLVASSYSTKQNVSKAKFRYSSFQNARFENAFFGSAELTNNWFAGATFDTISFARDAVIQQNDFSMTSFLNGSRAAFQFATGLPKLDFSNGNQFSLASMPVGFLRHFELGQIPLATYRPFGPIFYSKSKISPSAIASLGSGIPQYWLVSNDVTSLQLLECGDKKQCKNARLKRSSLLKYACERYPIESSGESRFLLSMLEGSALNGISPFDGNFYVSGKAKVKSCFKDKFGLPLE